MFSSIIYKPLYLNAIQTICPHILRYLATAVIINRDRHNALKDLIKVIQQESYIYSNPITEFLECLYVNCDFEEACLKLHKCQTVIINDFFIVTCLNEFFEDARLMIFETLCRTHRCIPISVLAEKLNMEAREAEYRIVNLIRTTHLNARIDSKLGHVVMGTPLLSSHQKIMRSEHLLGLIERKNKKKTKGDVYSWKYY